MIRLYSSGLILVSLMLSSPTLAAQLRCILPSATDGRTLQTRTITLGEDGSVSVLEKYEPSDYTNIHVPGREENYVVLHHSLAHRWGSPDERKISVIVLEQKTELFGEERLFAPVVVFVDWGTAQMVQAYETTNAGVADLNRRYRCQRTD